jgi:nucleoid-associated protein YgaU
MSSFSIRIIAIPLIALAAAIGAVLYFRAPEKPPVVAVTPQSLRPAQPQQTSPRVPPKEASPVASPPESNPALPQQAAVQPSAPAAGPKPPEFDIVRVTPGGETVVAGRAPGAARVELLDRGRVVAGEKVDRNGEFVLLPPSLGEGDHLLALRITPEGQLPVSSNQSVAVAVRPGTSPLVTLAEPGKPSVVLAAPAPGPPAKSPATTAAPASGQVTIRTAEVEAGGHFFATGTAPAGSTVRLYLNGSHIADAASEKDGKWSLTINKGVSGGKYVLRADVVGEQGKVLSRAEVPFDAPAAVAAAAPTVSASPPRASQPLTLPRAGETATAARPTSHVAAEPARPSSSSSASPVAEASQTPSMLSGPGAAPAQTGTSVAANNRAANPVIPEISAATVTRGDSLWRISRRHLGKGMRYTVIYEANSSQIRNPNLIYAGQVLVMPRK